MAAYAQVPLDTTAVFGLDSIVVASTIRTNGIDIKELIFE